jgi:hypothetical protein
MLRTSGIQQQNTPAPRILEDRMDKLLEKAKLPMREDEVQQIAEVLEKVSRSCSSPDDRFIEPTGDTRC